MSRNCAIGVSVTVLTAVAPALGRFVAGPSARAKTERLGIANEAQEAAYA